MVGRNGMDNVLMFAVLPGKIRADDGMRAFNFMIDGLAYIVQM